MTTIKPKKPKKAKTRAQAEHENDAVPVNGFILGAAEEAGNGTQGLQEAVDELEESEVKGYVFFDFEVQNVCLNYGKFVISLVYAGNRGGSKQPWPHL